MIKKKLQLNRSTISKSVSSTDWNFVTSNTKELTHEIHRYSGKYIPQIARKSIELISFPGETVLDPYVGSGTTLLEANLSGRNSVGIDINPLAVLITRAKNSPIAEDHLENMSRYFKEISFSTTNNRKKISSLLEDGSSFKTALKKASGDSRKDDAWYQKWFNDKTLFELLILDHAVNQYHHIDAECAILAKVALSNILRKCSNAHSGYPNVMLDKSKNNEACASEIFIKSLTEIINKIKELNKKFNPAFKTEVLLGDATKIQMADNSIDAIVTHPPYIGSVPYAEYGVLSLKWLGYDPKELDAKLTGGKRQSKDVVSRFTDGYEKMLSESFRVLKKGRFISLLTGDPTVKGQFIDLARLTKELSTKVGFTFIAEKKRGGINRRANKMGEETILFFQKN